MLVGDSISSPLIVSEKCSISTCELKPARWCTNAGGGLLGFGAANDGGFGGICFGLLARPNDIDGERIPPNRPKFKLAPTDDVKRAPDGLLGVLRMHCFVANQGNSRVHARHTPASSFWCMIAKTVRRKKYRNTVCRPSTVPMR